MRGIFILFADAGHKGHDLVSPLSRENTVITKGVLCKTPFFSSVTPVDLYIKQ